MALLIIIATLALAGIVGTVIALGHKDSYRLAPREYRASTRR